MEIGFIDFSKEERNKILSTLKLLGDQTALDELGIGTLRDAYADILFPGISTLQTRAKYFVLIPYLFSRASELARQGKLRNGQEMIKWLYSQEDNLVETLVQNSEKNAVGIIGSLALKQKRAVKVKPSAIYWSGLRQFGILRSDRISLQQAASETVRTAKEKSSITLKTVRAAKEKSGSSLKNDDEGFDDSTATNSGTVLFSPLVPDPQWEKNVSIALTKKEAGFLKTCISRSIYTRGSLLDFLVKNRMICNSFDDIPIDNLPPDLRRDYTLAREFSRFIFGAHIRYNVIFSNESDDEMLAHYHTWRQEFLSQPFDLDPILKRVPCNSGLDNFCRGFLDAVNRNDLAAMDELIVRREIYVKGDRAKLRKPNEYRYDPGKPVHFYPLDFRFGRANVIIRDILDGLGETPNV